MADRLDDPCVVGSNAVLLVVTTIRVGVVAWLGAIARLSVWVSWRLCVLDWLPLIANGDAFVLCVAAIRVRESARVVAASGLRVLARRAITVFVFVVNRRSPFQSDCLTGSLGLAFVVAVLGADVLAVAAVRVCTARCMWRRWRWRTHNPLAANRLAGNYAVALVRG